MSSGNEAAGVIETDVLIIGGGLAGLTCAVGLRGSGLSVTVVERDKSLGGRARSWTDPTTGDPVHIGPHIFLSQYPNTWRLFELLGTKERVVWEKNERFITLVEGTQQVAIKGAELPAPAHYLPSLLNDPGNNTADVLSNWWAVQAAIDLDEKTVLQLDRMNAYAYLRSVGVSERFIQRFWAFTSMAIMNVPLEVCSAGALMRFFHHLIGHQRMRIGFPDRGLGDLFAPQAQALIQQEGGQVLTDTEVAGFTGTDAKVTGVRLRDGREIRARFCVAAVPPQALRRLARPAWAQQHTVFSDLVHFLPVPYVSPYLWFDRKLTDLQFWARTFNPADLNCDFYDLSNIDARWNQRGSVIASNIIYSHRATEMSDEEIVTATINELAEFVPEVRKARLLHQTVHRIPMAIHAPFPGMEQRRPEVRTPVQGLMIAGDWIQTAFPSSMESAVASGWRAAEHVLADIGRKQQLVASYPEVEGLMYWLRRTGQRLPYGKFFPSGAVLRRIA